MPQGVTSVAATDFSSNVCTLKMNPTSTAGEKQITGAVLTVTASANNDDLVLPPVGQCEGLVLHIVNVADAHGIDIKYVNSSGSVVDLQLGVAVNVDNDEIATCICDGTYWYASVTKPSPS
tara:strand:+ start:9512 stop:9874 length:363 start_codon:yes stop_codon:yes gene_type:complete